MSPILNIALRFNALLNEGKFKEASELLTDDFVFKNPKFHFDKALWLNEFPAFHRDPPTFGEFERGTSDNHIKRVGKKRVMMMNITILETREFTKDGKIKSIIGAKG